MADTIKGGAALAFTKFNPAAWLRVMSNNSLGIIVTNDVPTNGTSGTGFGKAGPGSLLININAKTLYQNTNTKASPTWTLVASSSGSTITNATIGVTNTVELLDTLFTLDDNGDPTKQMVFQLSGITTGTKRTLTVPDADLTIVGTTTTQTLTNKTLTAPTLTTPAIGVATGTSLAATGALSSSSPSAGIGYATGAGGTVAQITSKATGVALNALSGAITLNNANLAAGTIVSFVLTDTSIVATDVLILNHISGGTVGSYTLNAQAAAGSATINVRNNTAGGLAEAIVIQFVVIKAVNA